MTPDKELKFDMLIAFFDAWDYKHGSRNKDVQEFLQRMKAKLKQQEELIIAAEELINHTDINCGTNEFDKALERYNQLKKYQSE